MSQVQRWQFLIVAGMFLAVPRAHADRVIE
jgi:hypothetical protein